MKTSIALVALLAVAFSGVNASMSPALDLLEIPVSERLTLEDYDKILTFEQFRLGITRQEAIKNMAVCTYNAARLAIDIYTLINAFQLQNVPGIIKRVITCVDTCQSFKYLQLTKACGNSVLSAANNLKVNFNIYEALKDPSRIKTGISQLRTDLKTIEVTCVVVD